MSHHYRMIWPLTPKIDRAKCDMGRSDMQHGGLQCSDMGHSHFLNLTYDIDENKRQSHVTLPSLQIDTQHWGPPSRAPMIMQLTLPAQCTTMALDP